ncbi:unnamed protein product [Paramecium pentaurelia]|uniref:Uncharacterized protein n=1 Tax=Paramecium pentaurelia TaxID=43138 RepID=A0A8S1V3A6_9CILI|nr:unnamed protein product [Paramecium pentaurelia]
MNQNIKDNLCRFLKAEGTYKEVKPYLEKIYQKDQQYYEPICQAIVSAFREQNPIQCFLAARMAKEAIEKQNNDFLTVFQDICLQEYEQLAGDTLNIRLHDKANQFFKRSNDASSYGISFFHLILESIHFWARQYQKKNDGFTPTKFYQTYQNLMNKGIQFPQANYFEAQPTINNNKNNIVNKLDIVNDLENQLKLMKEQHEIELSVREQTYAIELYNLQEENNNYKNFKQILDEQIQDYKRNEDKHKKVQQEFREAQIQLKQLEIEVKNSKLQEEQLQKELKEKKNLQYQIQQQNEQIKELQQNNQILKDRIQQQENRIQPQNDLLLQNQIKELQKNNMTLKTELDNKIKEIQEQKIQCLEQEQNIYQLKLQLKAKEKLNSEANGYKNYEEKQIIQKYEQSIQDLKRSIKQLEGENKFYAQNLQEQQKKNQNLEVQILNSQQKQLASENKIKELQEQLDQLKQISPIRSNSSRAQVKQHSATQFQNFFPAEPQRKYIKNFNLHYDFQEDFNQLFTKPKPIEVENINATIFFPYKTPEQYYSSIPVRQHKGTEITYQNQISVLKDLKQKNKYLFQIFHVNRTTNYFIDLPSIQVAIVKQVQKLGEQYQICYGIYFKTEEQSINLSGKFIIQDRMFYCLSSPQTDFNVTLTKKQQYILEYSINDKCKELEELLVLEIIYKEKIQQLFLPISLLGLIDFQQVTKETFKKCWKQFQILRSKKFNYNSFVLPQYDSILHISKCFILINKEKLMPYLQGIDEIKYGAQFKLLGSQLEGLLKFEFIPQNQMIIYLGVRKEKHHQFQYLINKIINSYHSIFQSI